MAKYRIQAYENGYGTRIYAVQVWRWFFPFWVTMERNTYTREPVEYWSVDRAREFLGKMKADSETQRALNVRKKVKSWTAPEGGGVKRG